MTNTSNAIDFDSDLYFVESLNGAQIAAKLNVSVPYVSQTLKSALSKVYKLLKKENNLSPFEVVSLMMYLFKADECDCSIIKFYKLLPSNIKREIEKDAKEKRFHI